MVLSSWLRMERQTGQTKLKCQQRKPLATVRIRRRLADRTMGSLIPCVATIHPVSPRQIKSLPIRVNSSSSPPPSPPGRAIYPEEPMQRLITIRRHMDSHDKPYRCPYPKCQHQRHINGFSRQDNLQVHINTYHKGKGKGTQQPSRVVKKQRITSRRQGQN